MADRQSTPAQSAPWRPATTQSAHPAPTQSAPAHPAPAQSAPAHPAPAQSAPAHSVTALFSRGRLVAIPRKAARREQLMGHLARTLFTPGRTYREAEVNEALLGVHEDFPALRRFLVVSGHLERTNDGSAYRVAQ